MPEPDAAKTIPRGPGVDSAYRIFAKHIHRDDSEVKRSSHSHGWNDRRGTTDEVQRLVGLYEQIAKLAMGALTGLGPDIGFEDRARQQSEHRPMRESATAFVRTSIPLVLIANRPCEVVLELYPFTNLEELKTDDLVLVPEKPPLTNLRNVARFRRLGESPQVGLHKGSAASMEAEYTLSLHVDIPVSAAAGHYQAEIFDESNQRRGILKLSIT